VEIRLATRQDAQQCNELFKRTYRKERTLEQWQWEFLPREFQADALPYVVILDQGRIVGSQAFIPVRMIDENGVFWTAKSEESILDPTYRGQGLFEKMYQVMFDYLREHGIHCIWGFTPAAKAFGKLGFDVSRVTSQIFLPFAGRAVTALLESHTEARQGLGGRLMMMGCQGMGTVAGVYSALRRGMHARKSPTALKGMEVRTLTAAPRQAGDLALRFIGRFGGMTIYRDEAYLTWRLFDNPYVKTTTLGVFAGDRLLGFLAYSLGSDGMGYLIDVMAAPAADDIQTAPEILAFLIDTAVAQLKEAGALGVRGWHVNAHPFDAMVLEEAKKLGFYHVDRGHTVVLYPNPESTRREAIEPFDRWFVTRIYTEGVTG
jgi:L-amino acid N-acyltransferase YncA